MRQLILCETHFHPTSTKSPFPNQYCLPLRYKQIYWCKKLNVHIILHVSVGVKTLLPTQVLGTVTSKKRAYKYHVCSLSKYLPIHIYCMRKIRTGLSQNVHNSPKFVRIETCLHILYFGEHGVGKTDDCHIRRAIIIFHRYIITYALINSQTLKTIRKFTICIYIIQ